MTKRFHRRDFLQGSVAAASIGLASVTPQQVAAQGLRHDELVDDDAFRLAARVRAREISQAELVDLFIRRVEVMNPALNFMTNDAFARARKSAGSLRTRVEYLEAVVDN